MLLSPRRARKSPRLIPVPLPECHPDWLALDRELAPDHLARRIRCVVEQLDLTDLFDSFAGVGSPANPPDLLLQLVLFESQRQQLSPAVWFRDSRESLPARWLLRGLRPARCVFYRFRTHWPLERIDALNQQVLHWAQAEGHTAARCGALDGTFHAAAGSRHQLLTLNALNQRCEQLDAVLALEQAPVPVEPTQAGQQPPPAPAAPLPLPTALTEPAGAGSQQVRHDQATAAAASQPQAPVPANPPAAASGPTPSTAGTAAPQPLRRPRWMARSQGGRRRQHRRYQQARQTLQTRLVDHDQKQKRQRKANRRPAQRVKICPSEPEAVLGKDKMKVFRPLYNTQILQDIDSPFVLGYGVYASVTDAGLLPPMLQRTRTLTGSQLEELLVDGIYARLLDVRYCLEQDVRLYAPVAASRPPEPRPDQDQRQGPEVPIGKDQFTWLAQEQTYRCPQGHLLQLERRCREARRDGESVLVAQYRCAAEHCQGCPLARRCTKRPDKGRTIKRLEGQELLDALAQRMQTEEGKQRYRYRCRTVELRHADFRQHRGLQRFRSYGLAAAQSQVGLMVLVHNGLALLAARAAQKDKLQEANSSP